VLLIERLRKVAAAAQDGVLVAGRHLQLVVRHGEQLVAHAENAADGDHDLRDATRLRIFQHEVLHRADLLPLRVANLGADDLARAMRALPRLVRVPGGFAVGLARVCLHVGASRRAGGRPAGVRAGRRARRAGGLCAHRAQREREARRKRGEQKRMSRSLHG
jgi:hypothetical protein